MNLCHPYFNFFAVFSLVHGLVAFRLNEEINNESVRQMEERESVWTEAVSVLISLLNATDQQGPLSTKCYVLEEKLSEGRGEPLEQLAHQLMQLILQQYQQLKHANKVKTEEMDSDMEAPKYNVQLVSVLTKCVCRLLQNGLILPKVIVNQVELRNFGQMKCFSVCQSIST